MLLITGFITQVQILAQPLTGIKTILTNGGDYSSFNEAVTALNLNGAGPGGVTFKVAANAVFNEANILITATGSSSNPIIFIRDGTGADPIIKGQGVNGSVNDYFIRIQGGDYITFDGIDLATDPTITDDLLKIEYGFYITNAASNDGAKNIIIKNCSITLERTETNNHTAIYARHEISPTEISGTISNLLFDNIIVKKGSDGIVIFGRNTALPSPDIVISNCKIGLPGIDGMITSSTGRFGMGIMINYGENINIFNNEIQNITTTDTYYGIYTFNLLGINNIYNNIIHNLFSSQTTPDIDVMGIYHVSNTPTITNIYNNLIFDLDDSQTSGSPGYFHLTGLYNSGTASTNIYYNTVCLSSINPYTLSVPLWITGAYNVKNNIIADFSVAPVNTNRALVLSSGTAILENNLFYIDESIAGNYSFVVSAVNYKFKVYQKGSVKPSPGYYLNNIFENPNFANPDSLIPGNPSPASGNGQPIPSVTSSLDGVSRSAATPDIGAYEGDFGVTEDYFPPLIRFQPIQPNSDAIVNLQAWITDNIEVTSAKLWYRIKNSTADFTEVPGTKYDDIWKFSFTPPQPDIYEYFLCAKDGSGNIISNGFLTSGLDVSKTGLAINNPSPSPECIYNFGYKETSISGDITIGYESANYTSLSGTGGLFDAINNSIVSGNINAIITTDLLETGSVDLKQWTESGAGGYKLTIKPHNPTLHTLITLTTGKSVTLNGADRVTIDGSYSDDKLSHIKIENSNSNTLKLISDGLNGCEDITIRYCNLTAGTTSALTSIGSNHRNWLLDNIFIDKATAGMNVVNVNNVTISNCTIGSTDINNTVKYYGLYILGSSDIMVEKNTIRNIITNADYAPIGILIMNVTGGKSIKNKITGVKYTGASQYGAMGVYITGTKNLILANNIISDINGNGSSNTLNYMIHGLYVYNSSDLKLYYNSINLYGTGNSVNNAFCTALYFYGTSRSEISNNIFSNCIENTNSTTFTYALYHESTYLDNSNLFRNNIYYAGGSGINNKFVVKNWYQIFYNLREWQSAENILSDGIDLGSGSFYPAFVSGTTNDLDLTTNSPALNSGIPVPVTDDFNGQPRNGISPDIGAYENSSYSLLTDVCAPVISFVPIQNNINTTFSWSVTVTDNSGVNAARLWLRSKGSTEPFNFVEGVKQPDNKTWSFTISPPLNVGWEYEYYVCARDNDGNIISNGITISNLNIITVGLSNNSPAANPVFVRTFKVTDNSITPGNIMGPVFVSETKSASLNIPYAITGTYSLNDLIVWLSDKAGSFTNKTEIGRITSNTSGSVNALIPARFAGGSGYKIMIESTNPVITSSESNSFTIVNDAIAPRVNITSGNSNYINSPFLINITFSETVTGFTEGDIVITNGTVSSFAGADQNYSALITPDYDGLVTALVPFGAGADLSENLNIVSNSLELIYVEKDSPKLNISASDSKNNFSSGIKNIRFEFDQDITGFDINDVLVTNGTKSNFTPVIPYPSRVFTMDITPFSEGQILIKVPSESATNGTKGNSPSSLELIYDITKPSVLVSLKNGTSDVNGTFTVLVIFDQNMQGFDLSDISVINGLPENLTILSPAVYSVDILPDTYGIVSFEIPEGVAFDPAGNTNLLSNNLSVNYIITGIEELNERKISVYPNPTSGPLTIGIQHDNSIFDIVIKDLNGKTILTHKGVLPITLSLEGYKPGFYFLVIYNDSLQRVFPIILK